MKQSQSQQALVDAGWPPELAKATEEAGQYALGLRARGEILFVKATRQSTGPEWVTLRMPPPKGDVTVRVSEIAWIEDRSPP